MRLPLLILLLGSVLLQPATAQVAPANFFIGKVEYAPGTIPGWLTRPMQVFDGGAGFWHIYYNLTTHTFYDFSHGIEG